MGCGCNKGRTGNSQQRTAVYRQSNMAAPQQSFSPPVPQQQPPAPAPANITYNVQNVSAPTPNAQTNEHVRRIAWDRSRRDAIRRSLGR